MKELRTISFFIFAALVLAIVMPGIAVGEDQKININQADTKELCKLDGIGPKRAEDIIKYREANGPFQKTDEITLVKGVGKKIFEANKDKICVK